MKKIKDMGKKELYVFIIIMVTVFFIFGMILGAIMAQEDLIKTNVDAHVCYFRCPNDFQCFKTCFWAKTHDIGFAKIR